MIRLLKSRAQEGNAVLFSLIIMAAAITVSLGMASIVVAEITSVGLFAPSERAYYKAESYVEQALWEKKANPAYNSPQTATALNAVRSQPFVCPAFKCFLKEADGTNPDGTPDGLLQEFFATSSPVEGESIKLIQDQSKQLDVNFGAVTSGTLSFDALTVDDEAAFKGIEITIAAFPKGPADSGAFANRFPVADPSVTPGLDPATTQPTTPVFIDKVIVNKDRVFQSNGSTGTAVGANAFTFTETTSKNALGESYPSISGSTYRLRFKALGSGATMDPKVSTGSTDHELLATDFTVQAVAEDARTRRGIRVLVPAAEQINDIFDYVLFSDITLDKLKAKKPADATDQSISGRVIVDTNKNCVADTGDSTGGSANGIPTETGQTGIRMKLEPNNPSPPVSTADAEGNYRFASLAPAEYTVSVDDPSYVPCNPASRTVSVAPGQAATLPPFLVSPQSGLKGEYFRGTDFNELVPPSYIDPSIGTPLSWPDFIPTLRDRTRQASAQYASVRWTGAIFIEQAGRYRFCITVDDNTRLYIDDQLIINDWGQPHSPQRRCSNRQTYTAGWHPIQIDYRNSWPGGEGGAAIRFEWDGEDNQGADVDGQVPTSNLRPYR